MLGMPGAPCKTIDDCVAKSPCIRRTCEFPGPCSVRMAKGGKEVGRRTFTYDDELRITEMEERADGEVSYRYKTTWSEDGRTSKRQWWSKQKRRL